jgi:hypothetical protein
MSFKNSSFPITPSFNKAIIVLNPIILGIILSYNAVNEFLTRPLAFVLACIFSMFVSLCMWGYKYSIEEHFEKNFGNRGHMTEWHCIIVVMITQTKLVYPMLLV